jgi:hypothetical protein
MSSQLPLVILSGIQTIQVVDDRKRAPEAGGVRPQTFRGSLESASFRAKIDRLNRAGAGIFFSVNETNEQGRKKSDIVRLRAWFVDCDGIPEDPAKRALCYRFAALAHPPSAVVETRNGLHAYWYAAVGEPVSQQRYQMVARGLALSLGGDVAVTHIASVARLPNTLHQKGEAFAVRVVYEDPRRTYSSQTLLDAYPLPASPPASPPQQVTSPQLTPSTGHTPYGAAVLRNAANAVRSAAIGQRNQTLNRRAFVVAQFSAGAEISEQEAQTELQNAALAVGLSEVEVEATLKSAWSAGVQQPRNAPALVPTATATLKKTTRALRDHEGAMRWLIDDIGLSLATIERYAIGFDRAAGRKRAPENVLLYPLRTIDGQPLSRQGRVAIPNVTTNAVAPHWQPGVPETYWLHAPGTSNDLVVVPSPVDGWRLAQLIHDTPAAESVAIVTSPTADETPPTWQPTQGVDGAVHGVFDTFNRIILAYPTNPAGEHRSRQVASTLRRPNIFRIQAPDSWISWCQTGGTADAFTEFLNAAEPLETSPALEGVDDPNEFEAARVAITNAIVHREGRPYAYYPYTLISRGAEVREDGTVTETLTEKVFILRSDGERVTYDYAPAPRGTPKSRRVLVTSDGTLIWRAPTVSRTASWSLTGINRFRAARAAKQTALTYPIEQVVEQMFAYLRAAALLPRSVDYSILVGSVLVSYIQNLFDAVGYVHLLGPGGSGKSQLAIAMSHLGCNPQVVSGETSGATIARALDDRGGIAIFDDLESIRKRGNARGDDAFSVINQIIKTGYKKETAVRAVTDVNNDNALNHLTYYGVKVISSTTATDDLVGERMFTIRTQRAPRGYRLPDKPDVDLRELRANLHAWVYENLQHLYTTLADSPPPTARFDEITRPLRIIASVLAYPPFTTMLEAALKAQHSDDVGKSGERLEATIREALRDLVQAGRTTVHATHLAMEVGIRIGPYWGKAAKTEVGIWEDAQRFGSLLQIQGWVETTGASRPRWLGQQRPVYRIGAAFIDEIRHEMRENDLPVIEIEHEDPLDFCLQYTHCAECPYTSVCQMQEEKPKWATKMRRRI